MKITTIFILIAVLFAMAAEMKESDTMDGKCCPAPAKELYIVWERLLVENETCPRCGTTEAELNKAAGMLQKSLAPLGITVNIEKKEITLAEFKTDSTRSNRIMINGRTLEEWLGAQSGQSPCCDVCGDEECRTVEVAGETYEAIPADLIVRAGLVAAAAIPITPPDAPCSCGGSQ
jgi:hypothetical protein